MAPQPDAAPAQLERLRKAKEAAEFLGVSLSWLRHATAAGTVPCVRFGGHVRYDLEDLRAWAKSGGKPIGPARVVPLPTRGG